MDISGSSLEVTPVLMWAPSFRLEPVAPLLGLLVASTGASLCCSYVHVALVLACSRLTCPCNPVRWLHNATGSALVSSGLSSECHALPKGHEISAQPGFRWPHSASYVLIQSRQWSTNVRDLHVGLQLFECCSEQSTPLEAASLGVFTPVLPAIISSSRNCHG